MSLIVGLVQPQLISDARHGAGQLLAQRLGTAAQLGGDAGPVAALAAQLRQLPLLGRQAALHLGEQLAGSDLLAGAGAARCEGVFLDAAADNAAGIATVAELIAAGLD